MINSGRRYTQVSIGLLGLAVVSLFWADLEVYAVEPWQEMQRIALGFVHPDLNTLSFLLPAVGQTIAFALLAVAGSAILGLLLALVYNKVMVRIVCASVRAVHELFWGLIFMQVFGLSATTGILAILIPYTGTFAKMYADIFEQQSTNSVKTVSTQTSKISLFAYTLLPLSWHALAGYTRYRFECALRSSTILGFIGLPTLGFYLETAFKQGQYSESAMLLIAFYVLIATIRFWLKRQLIPVYIVAAFFLLPNTPSTMGSLWIFLSQDIWPKPLLAGDWLMTGAWYKQQFVTVALPAIGNTLVLSQLALILSGVIALCGYGFASSHTLKHNAHRLGQLALLLMRSTPEMIFAFVFLLLFGPSYIPAIFALSIHNGGLIGFLIANQSEHLKIRLDAPTGLNLYFYELTPKLYGHFLAFLLYRWEVIIRESAILGILGITTLGFYIDSAFEDIRYDRAAFLIFLAALLNIIVDTVARRLRKHCQLKQPVTR